MLGVPAQRVHDYFIRRSAMPDTERVLLLLGWLAQGAPRLTCSNLRRRLNALQRPSKMSVARFRAWPRILSSAAKSSSRVWLSMRKSNFGALRATPPRPSPCGAARDLRGVILPPPTHAREQPFVINHDEHRRHRPAKQLVAQRDPAQGIDALHVDAHHEILAARERLLHARLQRAVTAFAVHPGPFKELICHDLSFKLMGENDDNARRVPRPRAARGWWS